MSHKKRHHKNILVGVLIAIILIAIAVFIWMVMLAEKEEKKVSETGSQVTSISTESATESIAEKEESESSPEPEELKYPKEWNDNGLFKDSYDRAYEILQEMTLEEKVGQMILARCPEQGQVEQVSQYHLGGYVLFGRDFKNKTEQQVKDNIASYQAAAKIPMAISVDEEGGYVVRISSNPNLAPAPFASPQLVYKKGGLEAVKEDTQKKVEMLENLGINVNLAPVCDVSTNANDYIYNRTFGVNAEESAQGIKAIVETMQKSGVSATLKHFPGYGNNVDTHTGIAIDKRSMEQFEKEDFLPFIAGGNAGAECVLVSHNVVNAMDSELPSSISPKVHQILRNDLGFTGIVMTDDMSMDAITKYSGNENPYVLAVLAGNNLLTVSDTANAYQSVLDAVNSGTLNEEQIDHAVWRVLAWKLSEEMMK